MHELLAQGLTNEEIAKLLYISLSTTKVHVKHIFQKLGVRSRFEAARALRDERSGRRGHVTASDHSLGAVPAPA